MRAGARAALVLVAAAHSAAACRPAEDADPSWPPASEALAADSSPERQVPGQGAPGPRPEPTRAAAAGAAVGCGGFRLSITLSPAAVGDGTDPAAAERDLRAARDRLLAPFEDDLVGPVELSPAIRAFRIELRDSLAAVAAAERLRASDQVQAVEIDECRVMITPPNQR
jgi:hypothetical protein